MLGARQRERGRVELAELQVRERGARGMGQHRAGADRPPGVRRPAPERGAAARSRAPWPGAAIAPASVTTPAQALPSLHSATHRGLLEHARSRSLGADELGEAAGDGATGLGPAGVDDAPRRVPALQGRRQAARPAPVEAHPALAELLPPPRAPRRSRTSTASARQSPRPALSVSSRMAGRRVVRRRAPPPARPGPRSSRSRPAAFARRAHAPRPARRPAARRTGRPPRRRPPRRPSRAFGGAARTQGAVTVPADRWGSTSRIRPRSSTTPGAHPENAARLRAIEAALDQARLAGARAGSRLRRRRASSSRRVHSDDAHRRDRGALRARAAA